MALVDLRYSSPPLQKMAGLIAIIPDNAAGDADGRLPTIYQLHGQSDDHTVWQRRTRIEQVAEKHGVMVVLLDGARSFYLNSNLGRYEDHIVDAIRVAERFFPAARDARRRGIGGLSMGGYGAALVGMKHPELYASIAAHSAAMDVPRLVRERQCPELLQFSGGFPPADDIFAIAEQASKPGAALPALRFDCGVDDFLLQDNRRLHAHLDRLGIPHTYEEFPGSHSWDYWDAHIDAAIAHHVASFARAMQAGRKTAVAKPAAEETRAAKASAAPKSKAGAKAAKTRSARA